MAKSKNNKSPKNKKDKKSNKNEKNIKTEETEAKNDSNVENNGKLISQNVELIRKNWKNKQRVLMLSSRGVSYLSRHVLNNLRSLMPHSKTDTKFDNKHSLSDLNEIAEIKSCNKIIFFEMRSKQDAYMWLNALPHGPSCKFHLENLHTLEELKLTGNCLKHSRPLLSFDSGFDEKPHLSLIKELLTQSFGTPNYHPKSQPFIDHVYNFSIFDNRIWFRNYQIVDQSGTLAEIGPRFVMNLIKIFDGSFSGAVLYENPHYVPPLVHRRMIREKASIKYQNRMAQKISAENRRPMSDTYPIDETDEIFKIK